MHGHDVGQRAHRDEGVKRCRDVQRASRAATAAAVTDLRGARHAVIASGTGIRLFGSFLLEAAPLCMILRERLSWPKCTSGVQDAKHGTRMQSKSKVINVLRLAQPRGLRPAHRRLCVLQGRVGDAGQTWARTHGGF